MATRLIAVPRTCEKRKVAAQRSERQSQEEDHCQRSAKILFAKWIGESQCVIEKDTSPPAPSIDRTQIDVHHACKELWHPDETNSSSCNPALLHCVQELREGIRVS